MEAERCGIWTAGVSEGTPRAQSREPIPPPSPPSCGENAAGYRRRRLTSGRSVWTLAASFTGGVFMQRSFWAATLAAVALFSAGCSRSDPATSGPWAAVAVGAVHTVALRSDGTLWAFGGNDDGQVGDTSSADRLEPVQVGTALRWSATATGAYHTAALTRDGALFTWGRNAAGQLGDGTTATRFEPTALPTTARFKAVAAGEAYTLALRTDGTVWWWGGFSQSFEPVPVATTATWKVIAAGFGHAVAIRDDGTLWGWGADDLGQLGLGNAWHPDPVQIGTEATWTAVAAGAHHTVGLRADGTIRSWGWLTAFGLGTFPSTRRWVGIAANEKVTLALRDDGTIWGNGELSDGRLGAGPLGAIPAGSPYPLAEPGPFVALAAGRSHGAAVKQDGTLWTWGSNTRGQLGFGTSGYSEGRRTPSATGRSFAAIAARSTGASAIALDGTMWGWGPNGVGQVGNGARDAVLLPVQASADPGWTALSGGWWHNVGLCGGALWGWGESNHGELGPGTALRLDPGPLATTATFAQVAAGTMHTVALRDDGTIWTFGDGRGGQLGNGSTAQRSTLEPVQLPTTATWTAIAAGSMHTLAIRSDGTLWAWGANYYGEVGDGTFTTRSVPAQIDAGSDWIFVAAGLTSSFGIRSDGSLWGWGMRPGSADMRAIALSPTYALTPERIGTDAGWTDVVAGWYHVLARRGGELYTWGANNYGQLGDGTLVSRTTPALVGAGTSWNHIAASAYSSYALDANGELHVWGGNQIGELGIGTAGNVHDRWAPARVP